MDITPYYRKKAIATSESPYPGLTSLRKCYRKAHKAIRLHHKYGLDIAADIEAGIRDAEVDYQR